MRKGRTITAGTMTRRDTAPTPTTRTTTQTFRVVAKPDSSPLPTYNGILNDNTSFSSVLIDSGATTQYISETAAKQLGMKIHPCAPRCISVADEHKVTVKGIVNFELKLEGLPKEKIIAYTFPLSNLDLILGLPWLKRYNPHTDWQKGTHEFTINGRRFLLHPKKPPDPPRKKLSPDLPRKKLPPDKSDKLTLCSLQEFSEFVDDRTAQIFVIDFKSLKPKDKPESAPSEEEPPLKLPRKLRRWIQRHCPGLLRDMGEPSKLEPFDIVTDDVPPIKINPRPYSPLDLAKIKEFIDENLANGVISESKSPWSFPIVLAAKPNGGTHVCVDYRALNRITRKDAHSLPRIDESLIKFAGMTQFSHIDLRSGYWQILLRLAAREKTAFSTRYGHYEFNVIPFGLSNAPGAFQRRMNQILHKFIDKFCIVYLDDILIYSRTKEEHEKHVKLVLEALEAHRMILNLKKCSFFVNQVKFLGHIIDENGSRPDPGLIEKVMNWPTPRNITDVRGFCNLVNICRKYIKRMAQHAAPQTDLMKGSPPKGASIVWGERQETAFQNLKKMLATEPVLKHPRIGDDFIIDADCSQLAIGAVLMQYFPIGKDGKLRLHPVAYESKKLSQTEQRYGAQERELLAIKYALHHWRYIIEGSPIMVKTDHETLKSFRTKTPPTPRLIRFINDIEHFDPVVTWRPGIQNKIADALSRRPGLREEGEPADTPQFLLLLELRLNNLTAEYKHTKDYYERL